MSRKGWAGCVKLYLFVITLVLHFHYTLTQIGITVYRVGPEHTAGSLVLVFKFIILFPFGSDHEKYLKLMR